MPKDEETTRTCDKEKVVQLSAHTEVKVVCGLGEHHAGMENGHRWHVAWQLIDHDTEVMFRWKA